MYPREDVIDAKDVLDLIEPRIDEAMNDKLCDPFSEK
jgi:hypothetical protein